uniref:Transmembrane protein 17 isoform X2 n=1 Tax=Geotrypetes seraphini TaxID=260995 RepID=A0A6P8PLQ5_GEOSA|nr:transmembrane protein 17 isoform X2 [Geotrypetes seraphini]
MALPEPVRRRLNSFSRNVFTDTNRTGPEYSDAFGAEAVDNEVVSNLPLQMSLYFNVFYFPFWWVCYVTILQLKYSVLPDYYKFILVTILILVSLIEVIRLYLGYMGNLQEKVPELAGFWLLSVLLQLPSSQPSSPSRGWSITWPPVSICESLTGWKEGLLGITYIHSNIVDDGR